MKILYLLNIGILIGDIMIEIVLITHGSLGLELLNTCEMILGKQDNIQIISILNSSSLTEVADRLDNIIAKYEKQGILIFTDMFGGSPSNISMAYLRSGEIEVITGVNLPMLIKAFTLRRESDSVEEISQKAAAGGKSSIRIARELLDYADKNHI